jgi:hypothetical protein
LLKSIGADDGGEDEESAASDVYQVLFPGSGATGGGEYVALAFTKAELCPALMRLGASARVSAALAADRDLAQIAAAASLSDAPAAVRWRARCRELAGACSGVSTYFAGNFSSSPSKPPSPSPSPSSSSPSAPSTIPSHATVFALWALARSYGGNGPGHSQEVPNSEDVGIRAARVMFSRLVERIAFNRRDRDAQERVALQQKMEDARAKARASMENLSDEQREILRERRKIGRVDDVESAVGEGAAATDDDAGSSASSSSMGMGDGEAGVVDAIDMYASD